MARAAALTALAALALAGCSESAPEQAPQETGVPDEYKPAKQVAAPSVATEGVTPVAERVATIGLLNKRNNLSQDLTLKPGEARRVGDVIVRLSNCERTAPWEMPKETGAFVQVLVRQRGSAQTFDKVFSGWLFKNSPALNVVEHPIYDVWVKDCTMSFPGEDGPAPTAEPAPAASSRPAPAPTPTPEPAEDGAPKEATA